MNGFFALVTRRGREYRYHVPGIDASDGDGTHPTVEAAIYEAKRTIDAIAEDEDQELPEPRPAFEMIAEASKTKAVAAVCITPLDP